MSTAIKEKALSLLGAGVPAEQTAAALGVTAPYISQLLSEEDFAAAVAEKKYLTLAKHNQRDESLDTLEDRLIGQINKQLPLMIGKPMEIVKAFQIVNGAKRRGQSAPASITNQQNLTQINIPTSIVNKFTVNINNQVTQAGNQDLLTIQSGTMLRQAKQAHPELVKQLQGVSNDAAPQRIGAVGTNQASATDQKPTRVEQAESRLPAPVSFVPVGVEQL